eukprot:8648496-Karenia_brevis.AAC.1
MAPSSPGSFLVPKGIGVGPTVRSSPSPPARCCCRCAACCPLRHRLRDIAWQPLSYRSSSAAA